MSAPSTVMTAEQASIPTVTLTETGEAFSASSPQGISIERRDDGSDLLLSHTTTIGGKAASFPVVIRLDRDEERLFEILRRTVLAYEAGELPGTTAVALPANNGGTGTAATTTAKAAAAPSAAAAAAAIGIGRGKLEVRVAGGWVRDKLLGMECHDVDVAVNALTGVQLAQCVQQYLRLQQQLQPQQQSFYDGNYNSAIGGAEVGSSSGRIGVIAANPAQSKHLETATMKVAGLEVDFCNLRANEIYEEHSRIPMCSSSTNGVADSAVVFGSPAEDAARRDFTVNALFYNLLTRQVEDWTGRGMADLRNGVLETPLDPRTTFLDDPLRVLRAIRFAVRYGFNLDPALEQACVQNEIHRALHIKVSRERVGKELEGMLSGKQAKPVLALDTIARLKLAGSVFCVPVPGVDCDAIAGTIEGHEYEGQHRAEEEEDDNHCESERRHIRELGWEEARRLLALLPPMLKAHRAVATETAFDARLLPLAVFLLPFRKLVCTELPKKNSGGDPRANPKTFSAVTFMFRDAIKFKSKDVQAISTLMGIVDRVADFLAKAAEGATDDSAAANSNICRLEAGLLVRESKQLWVTSLLLATVLKTRQQQRQRNDSSSSAGQINWMQVCSSAYATIVKLKLDECWKMRPLLDGQAVIQALDLPRGPAIGTYLEEQVRWMLQNPGGSRDECEQHLKCIKRKLEVEQYDGERDSPILGMSDGTGTTPSTPVSSSKKTVQHFSKKMHVEGMDM